MKPVDGMERTHSVRVADIIVTSGLLACLFAGGYYLINWSFFGTLNFQAIVPFLPSLAIGFGYTIVITVTAVAGSMLVALLLANQAGVNRKSIGYRLVRIYIEIGRNLPIIVILFWVHFALPAIVGISYPVLVSGLFAMILQGGAMLTAVVMEGLAAVPRGQTEAAASLGLTPWRVRQLVILPQALISVIPGITNIFISLLKASAVLSALSAGELWNISQQVSSYTFKPLETLTFAAVLYIIAGQGIMFVMTKVERRFSHRR